MNLAIERIDAKSVAAMTQATGLRGLKVISAGSGGQPKGSLGRLGLLQAVRRPDVYYCIAQSDIRRSPPALIQPIGFEQLE